MKGRLTLQQRLILPVIFLGLLTLLSNILAVFSINNVHSSAQTIVGEYMASEAKLEEIQRSLMDLHRLALSHIVAADHSTMTRLVQEIKAEEAVLDGQLADYEAFIESEEQAAYQSLLSDYESFKHALVDLVCYSADSKTQEAYATANGDVALYSGKAESCIDGLYSVVSEKAAEAQKHLSMVYLSALLISAAALVAGVLLIVEAFRIIQKYVIAPIRAAMDTLQDSSERISGVTGEVRSRTKNSSGSVRELSGLTDQLSAALEEISSSTSVISHSASSTQDDARSMAGECAAITAYAVEMRGRAEEIENSARTNMEAVRARTEEVLAELDRAIEKSRNVDQIGSLTEDILSISASTDLIAVNASIEAARAGKAGKGFAVVANEVRRLADSCAVTASHIQKVSTVVTDAVNYLSSSAQELVDYLGKAVLTQCEQSVLSGRQYREDSAYVQRSIEDFNSQVEHLRTAMDEIAGSISNISHAIDGAASGVSGAAGSTRSLVDDMAGITARMDTNQEIVEDLKKQMKVLANL
ncbi:MAG: methyl-accepting chemotaxis protein [Clostridiaceae bacterium]|nr:methyl-accepting chemotaxis protein [Clostridiaceae bacterium]